jgi:hypothetical protein
MLDIMFEFNILKNIKDRNKRTHLWLLAKKALIDPAK